MNKYMEKKNPLPYSTVSTNKGLQNDRVRKSPMNGYSMMRTKPFTQT